VRSPDLISRITAPVRFPGEGVFERISRLDVRLPQGLEKMPLGVAGERMAALRARQKNDAVMKAF